MPTVKIFCTRHQHTSGTSIVALGSEGMINTGLFWFTSRISISMVVESACGPFPSSSLPSTTRWNSRGFPSNDSAGYKIPVSGSSLNTPVAEMTIEN